MVNTIPAFHGFSHFETVVPDLFGTRDLLCRRQFFHSPGNGGGWGGGFGMTQGHYIYCARYFYSYYISFSSEHQALEPRGWGPHFKSSMPFPLGESYKGAKEVDNVCLISNSVYRIDKLCCLSRKYLFGYQSTLSRRKLLLFPLPLC